ncbi:MAG: sigma 54-interacting transcriptional regulator [Yoonia sp.]|uniref:sigma 54-interacting transcriptional regulator n=1 Tax=Yoonia sp. TaxID=2212373 RepID=UPI003EF5E427
MRDTTGKLALANNGTLHLDEVSDLPKAFQAKLIAVIQDGAFRRISRRCWDMIGPVMCVSWKT